jgi:hypothetical protein
MAAQEIAAQPATGLHSPEGGEAWVDQSSDLPGTGDTALETLAAAPQSTPREKTARLERDPDWWRQQNVRVDEGGVVRRAEPWLVRARFAIACTVACLALIAAIVMGTLKRGPTDTNRPMAAGKAVSAAHAAEKDGQSEKVKTAGKASGKARRKEGTATRPEGKGERKP